MSEQMDSQDASQTPPPELTPLELKASESGWVPKEQWQGDEDQWRPAKEFLDRGELFKKIESQNKDLKELRKALNELSSHHKSVRETEYKRALDSLKKQKKTALEDGDADTVIEIDDQIDLVRKEQDKMTKFEPMQEPAQLPQEFVNWTNRNPWYENDPGMRAYADAIGAKKAAAGVPPQQVLVEVEREIKQEFSHKFRNPNRDKPGFVENSSNRSGKPDAYQLSEQERKIMNTFVRQGIMTEKQYVDELKRKNGVA